MEGSPMATKHPIPVETLHQLLRLDPETGRLYWRERGLEWFKDGGHTAAHTRAMWNKQNAGREALTSTSHGYRNGMILRGSYMAHRVVFALYHGRWPVAQVDHRDRDRANNHPDNLREASARQNAQNAGKRQGKTSALCGVCWASREGKWAAQCHGPTGNKHLGYFTTEEAAGLAYDDAARRWHGEFACLNFPG